MSVTLSPPMFLQFQNPNNSGSPAVGFKLFTYQAGSTTKQATWTDSTQAVQNANPLPLDANGVAAVGSSGGIWGDPSLSYKFVWAPSNDTDPPSSPLRTIDNIGFPLSLTFLQALTSAPVLASYARTPAEIAAGVTPTNYAYAPGPLLDARRYGVMADGVTDNATALTQFAAVLKQTPGTIGILPSGTILCSSLTALAFNSTIGITLQGGSALNGTKLVYTGTGTGNFVDARSSFGFSMLFISLYHNNSGFTGNLISFSHDGSTNDSQHGQLFRCAFGSIGSLYTAVGVQLDQATLITVENCDFGALNKCIAGQNSAGGSYSVGIRVRDCQFAGYGFYAIYFGGSGWKITGNNFQANKDGLVEVFTANASTPCDGFQFSGNTVLDATGSSIVLVMYAAAAVDISGNVAGCGAGGAVFLQANGIIQGLSLRANHISQGNVGIQVANVAHVGWAINGNYFDTITTAIDHAEYVTGINLEGNTPNIMKRWFQQRIPVTYSASMTLDASQGNAFDVIATNNTAFTINAPSNPVDGERISIRIVNGAGVALGAVTWNAIFRMSTWTQPAANQNRTIDFEYNSTFSLWYQVSQTGVDVPN